MQILFAFTLLVSATLLFVVQPMFAKMVLPLLGGTPAVWNTCMVFYQATLLAGYIYAHLSIKWLGPGRQAVLHMALLCLPWLVLPIGVAAGWRPPAESNPIPWLLALLAVSVGLPFLVVSASAPMLQAWFAGTHHRSAKDPYFLYAASNVGSMLALLGYPFLIEPRLSLRGQACSWAGGYGLLMMLCLLCAVVLWRSRRAAAPAAAKEGAADARKAEQPAGEAAVAEAASADPSADEAGAAAGQPAPLSDAPLTWLRRLRWIALGLAPSSLLLGVTTHMTTNIASAPLFWVIPLELYLLSFVLVFARHKLLPHRLMLLVQPVLVVIVAASFFVSDESSVQLTLVFPLHLLAFFVTAMVCHGELAADRPAARYLTEFYLWMSLGGVLGGAFNALLAPLLFNDVYEYPLMIAAACLLRPLPRRARRPRLALALDFVIPLVLAVGFGAAAIELNERNFVEEAADWVVLKWPALADHGGASLLAALAFLGAAGAVVLVVQRRPVRFGLAVFALLAISLLYSGETNRPLYATRSFFGVLRVRQGTCYADDLFTDETHELIHGSILHGEQSRDDVERYKPWTYYCETGPVGQIVAELESMGRLKEIGVVGLGTGTMAAYGQPGRRITFFEIDPAVLRIASDPKYFTYLTDLKESGGQWRVVLGDARLKLADEPPGEFDLLAIDAFSSDAIPIHLLTREAIKLYVDHLSEHGVLAVHISNRHLDLEPVLGNLAADAGLVGRICDDDDEFAELGKCASTWVVLARRGEDLGDLAYYDLFWAPLATDPAKRLWTDDFSNLIDVIDWDVSWTEILPWRGPPAEE